MRGRVARQLGRLPTRRLVWAEVPDHERLSLLCRLAWHRWIVTTVLEVDPDGVDRVAGRIRECGDCGRVEEELRL